MAVLTSREAIKQDVLKELAPRDEALAKLPVPLRATGTGSTTTLIDTKLGRGTTQANRYDGRDIEVLTNVTVGPAVTIAFVDGGAGADTITDSNNGLALVLTGDTIQVSGSTSNDGDYLVATGAVAGTITLATGVLTTEAAGATVTITVIAIAAVDDAGFNGTSTVTYSPTIATAPLAGAKYLMYPLGLGPERLEAAIGDVLRETVGPHVYFPSLVADPDLTLYVDYVAATAAGAIVSVSSPTTEEYVTTSSGVFMGEKAVHIVAAGASDGFETANFSVTDTEILLVSVFIWVNVETSGVDVILYNTTGSAALKTVNVDEPAWTEVRFTQAVGSGVEQCKLQFLSQANLDDFYVSAPIIVQSTSMHSYDMPSWFTYPGQVAGFRYLDAGPASSSGSTSGDVFIPLGRQPRADHAPGSILDARGVHQVKLGGMIPADNRPVYVEVMREFDELLTNAATTPADRQYLRNAVVARILDRWGDKDARKWQRRASARAEMLGYNPREMRIEPNPTTVV